MLHQMFKIPFCEKFIQSVPVNCQTTAGIKYSMQTTEKEKSPILGSLNAHMIFSGVKNTRTK